jgi:hypothetical protein
MGALQFLGGKLLFVGGKLAMDPACCCDGVVPVTCSGNTFLFPQSVTVEFTGMANANAGCSSNPGVTDCPGLNGVHELAYENSQVIAGSVFVTYLLVAFGVLIRFDIEVPCISGDARINVSVTKTGPTCGYSWRNNSIPWMLDWTGQSFIVTALGGGAFGPCTTRPVNVPVTT